MAAAKRSSASGIKKLPKEGGKESALRLALVKAEKISKCFSLILHDHPTDPTS